jgi:SAM-dependent methyltransferase
MILAKAKCLPDGVALLNLACGYRMHRDWNNLDFSPLARLARYPRLASFLRRAGILSEKRYRRIEHIDPDIVIWDLRKGIPYPDNTFHAVYHSHFLEHLDTSASELFLRECYRVLRPGGVLRIVVPNLEYYINLYNSSLCSLYAAVDISARAQIENHKKSIFLLLNQLIDHEPTGTAEQKHLYRKIELWIRGTTSQTGEMHRWMYDSFTLHQLFEDTGFRDITKNSHNTSRITRWKEWKLDSQNDFTPKKPESLYMEGIK